MTTTFHPWPRFWARTLELLLFYAFLAGLLYFLQGAMPSDAIANLSNILATPMYSGLFAYALWIPIEALMVASFGTTPIRALFGISYRTLAGKPVPLRMAFKRSFFSALMGDAAGLPLINFLFRACAFFGLRKHRATYWDRLAGTQVIHVEWGVPRWVALYGMLSAILIFCLFLLLLT